MFGIKYFKADSATYVIKSVNGQTATKGRGLSFFYNSALTTIATVPMSTQECPFIFGLQTKDFQQVKVQGQVVYQVEQPEKIAMMLNFSLKKDGMTYVSEDPLKVTDRISRLVQSLVQGKIQDSTLREALLLTECLASLILDNMASQSELKALGIKVMSASIVAITPSSETGRALEAEAREAILKEADDAIYLRRKSSVEQERMIKEAELQTELSIQQKEQEIEEKRIENERDRFRAESETEAEKLKELISRESKRKEYVEISSTNKKLEADSDAYATSSQMKAFSELPVENLKAMAMANMSPEQLMALSFESLAQNADKIGELNISPDFLSSIKRAVQS